MSGAKVGRCDRPSATIRPNALQYKNLRKILLDLGRPARHHESGSSVSELDRLGRRAPAMAFASMLPEINLVR
jgi:hypothetical protein